MADLKASLCGELPNQNSVIPQEQLRDLLERRGIVEDPDIPNAKARLAEQELRRNMYHNTQVMLKHYRDIVWALECFPGEVAQELDQPLKDMDALLSVVDIISSWTTRTPRWSSFRPFSLHSCSSSWSVTQTAPRSSDVRCQSTSSLTR